MGRALRGLLPDALILGKAELDITDRKKVSEVISRSNPSVVINAAAYTKVDAAQADPETAYRVNADGAANLAQACESSKALLVQVSTDYVFSGEKKSPYLEDDETGPASVYGETKLAGEAAAQTASKHLIVRTSWVFGDGANFIRSILKAAKTSKELTVVADQWGLPTYAKHLAAGILELIGHQATGLYHLAGGGDSGNWAEVAEIAIAAAGLPADVRRVSTDQYFAGKAGPVAPRPANSTLDCSKAAILDVDLLPWRQAVVAYAKSQKKP